MIRRLWIIVPVSALLLIFPTLLALATSPDHSQSIAMTSTPVPLTVAPTVSSTPRPPSPYPTVQYQPTPFPVTQILATPIPPSPYPTVQYQPSPFPVTQIVDTPTPQFTPTVAELVPIPLIPGEQISGVLPAGQGMGPRYGFAGRAGQVVVIRLSSSEAPVPELSLATEGGHLIRDASAGMNQDTVLIHTLPDTAPYQIHIVKRSQSLYDTEYTLHLDFLTPQPITYGERIEDKLSSETLGRLFIFQGEAGDIVRVNLTTWHFVPYLTLEYAGAGSYPELARGFQSSAMRGGAQQIGPFVLPESGEYRIIARSLSSEPAPGTYTFTLDRIEPAPLAYGEMIEGELTPANQPLYYRFEGAYGDIVDIQVNAGDNADTALNVYGGIEWRQVARDDDSGRGLDPEILGYLLNQTGMYIIEVYPFVAGDTTPFVLSLSRNPDSLLDEGPRRVKYANSTLSFTGEAGTTVRLVIEVVQGVNTPMVTVMQGERVLLELGSTSVERLAVDFNVPVDGVVLVRLTSGGYAESVVEVSVRRISAARG